MELNKINERLTNIWNKNQQYAENYTKYAPEFIFSKPKTDGLLFIGLNPSLIIEWMNGQCKSKGLPEDCERILTWRPDYNIQELKDLYYSINPTEKYKKYFAPFDVFCHNSGFKDYEHLDLLYVRESQQKHIRNQLRIDNKTEEIIFIDPTFKKFFSEQITITIEIVNALSPKIICIFNALASRLVRQFWRIGPIKGSPSHWSMKVNGIEIPVYMGPMLSKGQMDIFTRERLQYDIKILMNL